MCFHVRVIGTKPCCKGSKAQTHIRTRYMSMCALSQLQMSSSPAFPLHDKCLNRQFMPVTAVTDKDIVHVISCTTRLHTDSSLHVPLVYGCCASSSSDPLDVPVRHSAWCHSHPPRRCMHEIGYDPRGPCGSLDPK
jgi:hypothetical protein